MYQQALQSRAAHTHSWQQYKRQLALAGAGRAAPWHAPSSGRAPCPHAQHRRERAPRCLGVAQDHSPPSSSNDSVPFRPLADAATPAPAQPAPSAPPSAMQDAAPAAPASAARPAASRRQVPTNILDKLFYHGKKAALNLTDTNTKIVNVPRGDPKFVYLLYYMHILAFTLYEVLEYAEPGSGLSQSLKDLIINDHAKSAAGEVWRFATCTFLHPTPFQLFLTLATLNTLAFELESLLGSGTFWAVYYLTAMTGSLLDAAFSDLDTTLGSGASIAGLVGALGVHDLRNWGLAKRVVEVAPQTAAAAVVAAASAGVLGSTDSVDAAGGASSSTEEECNVCNDDVEQFEGSLLGGFLFKDRSKELAALSATLQATARRYAPTMVDLASIQDGMTSWYGLGGALAAGAVLGLLIGPRYKVDPNPALDQLAGPNRRPLGASLRQLRRALIDKAVSTGFKPRGTSGVVLVVDEITGSLKQPIVFTAYTVALGLALIIYLHINGTTIV